MSYKSLPNNGVPFFSRADPGGGGGVGGRGAMPPSLLTFWVAKRKKGNREKRNSFKAETIERLSPRSKCYCFSHCNSMVPPL